MGREEQVTQVNMEENKGGGMESIVEGKVLISEWRMKRRKDGEKGRRVK